MKILKTLILFFLFFITSCTDKKEQLKITTGKISESVYASGQIKAQNQYIVFSTVSGVLQKINIVPNQNVTINQALFEIQRDKAELSSENAKLVYQFSQDNSSFIKDKIAEMEIKVQLANEKLALDKSILDRNTRIKAYNILSEIDYEKVVLAYKSSKLGYETALKQLSQLKAQLKNEQIRNGINLKINQTAQNDFTIKSAFSGKVFDVLVKQGSLISPQTPLAVIGKSNSYLIELDVDENDMVKVAIGQKIVITMDSYKAQYFEAVVDKIYPIMNERSRTFKIEAHFLKPPKKLYPNLTAEANIVIKEKSNTITIPREYLIDSEYVLSENNEKHKVKIGLEDYQKVEIISGLNANDIILKP